MNTETNGRKLTYKDRVRKEFTGSGLKEMFVSALIMFIFIYAINTYREGVLGLTSTLVMVGVFVVVWPVVSLFWVTLGYLVDKVRGDNAAEETVKVDDTKEEDTKEEDTKEEDTKEVTLQASAESDKEGDDRV